MTEAYTIGGDAFQDTKYPNLPGQTFRPVTTHNLGFIDLTLKSLLAPLTDYLEVFWADGSHKPFGPVLSHSRFGRTYYPYPGLATRVRYPMSPCTLDRGTYYALIFNSRPTITELPWNWQYDQAGATYLRGHRILSVDGGENWSKYSGQDHIFAEFGDPPAPLTKDAPPIDNFLPTDIYLGHVSNGICVTLLTNVPCHLTMFWTEHEPGEKMDVRSRRGTLTPWCKAKFFVGYYELEQSQAGDTLFHTFPLAPWTIGTDRWFTFRGDIAGSRSPSIGPIFNYSPTGSILLENPSFTEWPDPDENPLFWDRYYWGTGWSKWSREETDFIDKPYAAKLEAGGYARGTEFRQFQDATQYRGQSLTFKAWGKGRASPNNDLTVGCDGTGGWLRHDDLTENNVWQLKSVAGTIPDDATYFRVSLRCYSPGYGPVFGRWDKITIDA